jgi:hypothetical protein
MTHRAISTHRLPLANRLDALVQPAAPEFSRAEGPPNEGAGPQQPAASRQPASQRSVPAPALAALSVPTANESAPDVERLPPLPPEMQLMILRHHVRSLSGGELLRLEQVFFGQDTTPELFAHVAIPFFAVLCARFPQHHLQMSQVIREGLPAEMVSEMNEESLQKLLMTVSVLGPDTAIFRQLCTPRAMAICFRTTWRSAQRALRLPSALNMRTFRAEAAVSRNVRDAQAHRQGSRELARLDQAFQALAFQTDLIEDEIRLMDPHEERFTKDQSKIFLSLAALMEGTRDLLEYF